MPEYAKVLNGEILEIGPEPDSFEIPDTSEDAEPGDTTWVSTPEGVETDPKLLKRAGYLPVEDVYEKEDPNAETPMQYGEPTLEVLKTKVVRNFALEPIPVAPPDRITEIDQRLGELEQTVKHYKPLIDDWSQAGPVNEMDARALYGAYVSLRAEVAALRAELHPE